jgi:hypothetical protein
MHHTQTINPKHLIYAYVLILENLQGFVLTCGHVDFNLGSKIHSYLFRGQDNIL